MTQRLIRITWALAILASMALSLSAGMRWSMIDEPDARARVEVEAW